MNMPVSPFLQKLSVLTLSAVLAGGVSAVAYAQSTIVMDGTTGTNTSGGAISPAVNNTYLINGDGPNAHGTQNGSNLFYSFSQFGIASGDTALFQCPGGCSGVTNVISRVTENFPSNFNGTLVSTIGTANFWFFNPFGVNFNVNAVVNVPLSATYSISNAKQVDFSNGAVFGVGTFGGPVTDPNSSTLTSAIPASFGFGPVYDSQENLITNPRFFKTGTNTPPVVIPPPAVTPITPTANSNSPTPEEINTIALSIVTPVKPVLDVAMMNNGATLQLLNKPCNNRSQSSLISKGVANYIPDLSSQVPTSVLAITGASSLTAEQTTPLTLAAADNCR